MDFFNQLGSLKSEYWILGKQKSCQQFLYLHIALFSSIKLERKPQCGQIYYHEPVKKSPYIGENIRKIPDNSFFLITGPDGLRGRHPGNGPNHWGKSGGVYVTALGAVKKLDPLEGRLVLADGTAILIDDILEIEDNLNDLVNCTLVE